MVRTDGLLLHVQTKDEGAAKGLCRVVPLHKFLFLSQAPVCIHGDLSFRKF